MLLLAILIKIYNRKNVLIFYNQIFWKYYLGIIDDISGCTLYNYKNLKTTYYNSTVIGDIVDKYLNGDISKEKFIRQLSAATEIYLTE